VKEKVDAPAPITSDDDMDLLDDDKAPLIKDGSHHHPTWTSTWCSRYRPSSWCRGGGRSDVCQPNGGRV
jgi:hypothetical protein